MNEDVLNDAQHRLEERRSALPEPKRAPLDAMVREAHLRPGAIVEKRIEAAREKARLLAATEDAIAEWLRSAGVGKRLRRPLRDELVAAPLRALGARIGDAIERGESALLAGPPGTGKSCAAVWLMRRAYTTGAIEEQPIGPRWCAPRSLFVDAFFRSRDGEPHSMVAAARAARLLVIDDWGVPYESDWALAAFDRLVNLRSREMLSTIVTTNANVEGEHGFSARYPRAFSRLLEGGLGVVVMDGEDLRR